MRRCSYCGGVGHNRRTCPELKKNHPEHVERREKYLAERKRARDEYKAARGITTSRRCSFCGEAGHNRKTCPHLRTEVEAVRNNYRGFRLWLKENLINKGYGVGAVVKMEHNPANKTDYANTYEKDSIQTMIKEHGALGVIVGYNAKDVASWSCVPHAHGRDVDWTKFSDVGLDTWNYAPDTNGGRGKACILRVLFPNGKIRNMPLGVEFADERIKSAGSLRLLTKSESEELCANKIDSKFSEELSSQEIKDLMEGRTTANASLETDWE